MLCKLMLYVVYSHPLRKDITQCKEESLFLKVLNEYSTD